MTADTKLARVPAELKERAQWVCWRREVRGGKPTKVPYIAGSGEHLASTTNPATWRTFEDAFTHAARFDGIGFVFSADDPYCGIDLDRAIDSDTGEARPAALDILRSFPSYTELSPSGTGLHIICRAELPGSGTRKLLAGIEVEMYDRGRYFTITGDAWPECPDAVADCQDAAAQLYGKLAPARKVALAPQGAGSINLSDQELLEKARNAANGAEFSALFDDGDTSAFSGDESRADFALCSHLNFWTGNDADRVDRLFRQSALMRDKWERPDYRERTIANTVSASPYAPGRNGKGATKREGGSKERSDGEAGVGKTRANIDLRNFPLTDSGNAEMFAALHGDDVRYVHGQDVWFIWRGHWWRQDTNGEVIRLAKSVARTRWQLTWDRYAGDSAKERQDREASARHAARTEQAAGIRAMLTLTQAEIPIACGKDEYDSWDSDPWLLGVNNGVIDLRTGDLRTGRREDLITVHIPLNYDPKATCPRWERFIAEIFDGDPELMAFDQRAVGYSLTGLTIEQASFMLYGTGANGKSVKLKILLRVFSPLAYNMPFSTIEYKRQSSIPNDVAALAGRRIVTASETNENSRLNEGRLKSLVHGDPQTARFLNREAFTFHPQLKLWLAVNHKPTVKDDSEGFWRSVILIPFQQCFKGDKADPHLEEELLREAPGILAWGVRGALEWQRIGLKPPASVLSATQDYREECDPLADFIADACTLGPHCQVPAGKLFEEYSRWALGQGLRERETLTQTAFGRRMKAREAIRRDRCSSGNVYRGIGLRTEIADGG